MNADQLRRRALSLGGTLEIDGKTFNAGRQQLQAVKPRPTLHVVAAPAPPAPADPVAMIAEAMAMQTRLLADLMDRGKAPVEKAPSRETSPTAEEKWQAIEAAARQIDAALTPAPKPIHVEASALSKLILPVSFRVIRDRAGLPQDLKPTYGEVPMGSKLKALATTTDGRGLIETITPNYMN
ncbi:MAG: hypothetical protein RL030_1798 [Pseudomonadota bacterium]|jgi:hypothetical protein